MYFFIWSFEQLSASLIKCYLLELEPQPTTSCNRGSVVGGTNWGLPVVWWGVTVWWGVNKKEASEQLRFQSLACLQSRRRKEPKKSLKK